MTILGIETATLACSVCLLNNNRIIREITDQNNLNHSVKLVPNIVQLFDKIDYKKNKLNAVAISKGPGSFTGLRIGMAVAKSLAYALNIPILAVPTMRGMAMQCRHRGKYIIPIINAQQNTIYAQIYGAAGECSDTYMLPIKDIPKLIKNSDKYVFCGEISSEEIDIIKTIPNASIVEKKLLLPRAKYVAFIGKRYLECGMEEEQFFLEPMYIRKPAAEEKLNVK